MIGFFSLTNKKRTSALLLAWFVLVWIFTFFGFHIHHICVRGHQILETRVFHGSEDQYNDGCNAESLPDHVLEQGATLTSTILFNIAFLMACGILITAFFQVGLQKIDVALFVLSRDGPPRSWDFIHTAFSLRAPPFVLS